MFSGFYKICKMIYVVFFYYFFPFATLLIVMTANNYDLAKKSTALRTKQTFTKDEFFQFSTEVFQNVGSTRENNPSQITSYIDPFTGKIV